MKSTIQDNKKICFSYIRFSSKKQELGDSLDRQEPIAARVAKDKGWILREDLNAKDLGVSAFKGDNIKTLRAITEAVKSGKIPQGAVMIIEAFDRFSRADVDTAEDVLKDMLRAGLEVYVDRGGHHLTKDRTITDRIFALLELSGANEYSAKLSYRMGNAWKQKKARAADGVKLTRMVPAWLDVKVSKEGQSESLSFAINKKGEIVKRIFDSYANGKGIRTIMRELNAEKIPTFAKGRQNHGNGWANTHLRRLLGFRGVIGEYQPCKYEGKERKPEGAPIVGYYPAVVDKTTFYKVQNILEKQQHTGGCKRNATNLFTGLVKCHCGASMVIKRSLTKHGKNHYNYVSLICSHALRGLGCPYKSISYNCVERAVLSVIWSKVVPLLSDTENVARELEKLNAELEEVSVQEKKWVDIIRASDVVPSIASQQLNMCDTKKRALARSIEALSAKTEGNPLVGWKPVDKTVDNRLKLAGILKGEIESLVIDAVNRKALLNINEPECQIELEWEPSRGTNKTKKNESNESFLLDGKNYEYVDHLLIWKLPINRDYCIGYAT